MLEGSLRREGNRSRITAQLINARDGFHLWSDTYERELKDVFVVQDEITRSIVDALKIKSRSRRRRAHVKTPRPTIFICKVCISRTRATRRASEKASTFFSGLWIKIQISHGLGPGSRKTGVGWRTHM